MFSTTTACPSERVMPSARSRAITSVAAPGPVGTISLTGRLGQACAPAREVRSRSGGAEQGTAQLVHDRSRDPSCLRRRAAMC